MSKPLLTEEQGNFVKKNARNTSIQDLTNLVNTTFNLNLSCRQLGDWKKRYRIKSYLSEPILTEEQGNFVKEHAQNMSNKELANLVNTTFSLNLSSKQLNNWKVHRHIKGKTECCFAKGQKPPNWRPVGATKTRSNGYNFTKVKNNGAKQERWKLTHRLLWEKENGPIPEGYSLIFLDQDPTHISLDNLALVSKAECMIANKNKLLFSDKELTYSGLQVAKLMQKTFELKKQKQGKQNGT